MRFGKNKLFNAARFKEQLKQDSSPVKTFKSTLKNAIEQLKKYFIDWQNERVRPHSLVGQETEKGSDRNLFEMKLSGVEVRIDLDVSIMNCYD